MNHLAVTAIIAGSTVTLLAGGVGIGVLARAGPSTMLGRVVGSISVEETQRECRPALLAYANERARQATRETGSTSVIASVDSVDLNEVTPVRSDLKRVVGTIHFVITSSIGQLPVTVTATCTATKAAGVIHTDVTQGG